MSARPRLGDWLDERLGWRAFAGAAMDHPIAGGARWARALGSALVALLFVELVTGLALMTAYAPGATTAWASVHYIQFLLPGGWLVRGIHHATSDALLALLGAHLAQVVLAGAYRRPREITWWSGLALLGLTVGMAITGARLVWDQSAYWALEVEANVAGATPFVGSWVRALAVGGSRLGTMTLTRLYALHVGLLPLLVGLIVAGHVALVRRAGVTAPLGADGAKSEPFFPRQASRDLVAASVAALVVFLLAWSAHGAALGAPADPASDFPARPEWYLAPLFEMRKRMHGDLEIVATLVIPGIVTLYLALLPLLDRAPTAALRARLGVIAPVALIGLGAGLLTVVSVRNDARDAKLRAARAKADDRARVAIELAMTGVPAAGPLDMLAHDPELRGEALFTKSCATCHALGELGDAKKATAPALDHWGTEVWAASMLDDPDADDRFGRTAFKRSMPSMLHAPEDAKPDDPPFKPMPGADVRAVATYLGTLGADDKAKGRDPDAVKSGETIVKTRCTTCHLFAGEGDDSDQGTAPELSTWGTVGWIRAQIANPATHATYRDGALDPKLKGHMPRFDAELAADDVDLLARWVHAHARGQTLR